MANSWGFKLSALVNVAMQTRCSFLGQLVSWGTVHLSLCSVYDMTEASHKSKGFKKTVNTSNVRPKCPWCKNSKGPKVPKSKVRRKAVKKTSLSEKKTHPRENN